MNCINNKRNITLIITIIIIFLVIGGGSAYFVIKKQFLFDEKNASQKIVSEKKIQEEKTESLKQETKSDSLKLSDEVIDLSDDIQWEAFPIELDWSKDLGAPTEWSGNTDSGIGCSMQEKEVGPVNVTPYRVGKIKSGKYKGGELINIDIEESFMETTHSVSRFIIFDNKFISLPEYSDDIEDCAWLFIDDVFQPLQGNTVTIKSLRASNVLYGKNNKAQVVYKITGATETKNELYYFAPKEYNVELYKENKKLSFTDENETNIFYLYDSGETFFDFVLPDKSIIKYEWKNYIGNINFNDGSYAPGEAYVAAREYRCMGRSSIIFVNNKDNLVAIGKNSRGETIYLDKSNQIARNLYDAASGLSQNHYLVKDKTFEDFNKDKYLVLVLENSFGELVGFIKKEYDGLAAPGC